MGLALSNPTVSEATVTLKAWDYRGKLITGDGVTNPATVTVPAQGQRALRAVEIFGAGITGQTGWVELEASTAALRGFFLLFDSALSFIDGVDLTSEPAAQIVFPKVVIGGGSDTVVSFAHVGSGRLNLASIALFDNTGKFVASSFLRLEPFSGFSGPISELFPNVGSLDGYAVLNTAGTAFTASQETLIGIETYRERSDVAVLKGMSDQDVLRRGYLAHLASRGSYSTRLGLVNKTLEAQTVDITAERLEANGQPVDPATVTVTRTIPAFGRLEETAAELFNLSGEALITGSIRYQVVGETSGLIGYVDYGTTDGGGTPQNSDRPLRCKIAASRGGT